MIKRDAGAKDASDIIPGHGGVLDRMDSFILTAPVVYYYIVWVMGK
jgi:phosphatidate cytidylyltransferase